MEVIIKNALLVERIVENDLSPKRCDNVIIAYCVGAPLYKGQPINKVFHCILNDFFIHSDIVNEIKGNFLIVLYYQSDNFVRVISDRTQQHHLFFDKETGILSNSFKVLCDKRPKGRLELDKAGFYEKLGVGYHLTDRTVFKDIIRLQPHRISSQLNGMGLVKYVTDHDLSSPLNFESHKQGLKDSLESQREILLNYFSKLNETFVNDVGDLGLSGGFDCRLILALADVSFEKKLHLHTHATKNVHISEATIAQLLADTYGGRLCKVHTVQMEDLTDSSLDDVLNSNLDFFDNRSARHIGAYSQTYTRAYRESTTGDSGFQLNGLGGEIFRDSYFIGRKKYTRDEWFKRFILLQGAEIYLPAYRIEQLSSEIMDQLNVMLGWNKNYYDINFTHAFYGLIKMPFCNGALVSAYNRVSPINLPFFEYENVVNAIKAIPYFGLGGQYQSKLISTISNRLARLPSSYGCSFSDLSVRYYLSSLIKTIVHDRHRLKLINKRLASNVANGQFIHFKNKIMINATMRASLGAIQSVDENIDINVPLVDSSSKRNLISLGHLLVKYL